jgi:hypothetical protein
VSGSSDDGSVESKEQASKGTHHGALQQVSVYTHKIDFLIATTEYYRKGQKWSTK